MEEVLKGTSDPDYIEEQIDNIVHWDDAISEEKKSRFSQRHGEPIAFITECMLYAMSRGSVMGKTERNVVLADYLVKYKFPSVKKQFFGRQHELYDIQELLKKSKNLFLKGIGGIGKSELVKQFGKTYKKEYDNILFLQYSETLRRTITDLEFINDNISMSDDELFRSHYRFFKMLSANTLVILDNFNSLPEHEELFYEFSNLPFQLLVTTRSRIEDVAVYPITEIESTSELLQLFYQYAPQSAQSEAVVKEIIEEVYRHTLTVEMAAKTLTNADMRAEELLAELRKEGIALSNPNKVKVVKDEQLKNEQLYRHIQMLFRLQNLAQNRQYILRHMVLVSERGISKRLFHEWLQTNDFNTTNELIDYGWIQQDSENNQISLHPFICEVLKRFTKPSFDKCEQFVFSIFCVCAAYGTDVDYYQDILSTIETIIKNIEVDNTLLAFGFFDKVLPYFAKYDKFYKMEWALDNMKEVIPMDANHKMEKTNYELYRGILNLGRDDYQKAHDYFNQGINTLTPIGTEQEEVLAANWFCNLGNCYVAAQDLKSLKICIIYLEHFKKKAKIYTHDSAVQDCLIALSYAMQGDNEKAIDILEQVLIDTKDFPDFHTTLHYIYSLLGSIHLRSNSPKALPYFQKAEFELSQHLRAEEAPTSFLILENMKQIAKGIGDGSIRIEKLDNNT